MRPRTLLAFALLLLTPLMAWAGNASSGTFSLFTLADNDLSKKLLIDGIFGDINGAGSGSGLSGAVMVFNGIILTAAGLLAAYTIVAGTMQTAHDGTPLGKSWSSMWVPVRVAIGTAAMLPVLNGYNVAQSMIIWTAMQGMGAANTEWQAFTEQPVAAASFIAPDTLLAARGLAEKMLLSNVCVQAHNIMQTNSNAAADADGTPHFLNATINYAAVQFTTAPTDTDSGTFGYDYGSTGGEDSPIQCGTVTLVLPATGTSNLASQSKAMNDLANMPRVDGAVSGAMKSGLVAMQAALVPIATQIAASAIAPPPRSTGTNPPAADAVNSVVTAAAQAFADGVKQSLANAPAIMNQQVQQNMQQDGWLMAGAYYMKIAKAGQMFSDAAMALPEATGTDDSRRDGNSVYDFYVNAAVARARNLIVLGQPKGSQAVTGLTAQANADSNLAGKILRWFIADKNLGSLTSSTDSNALLSQNPVIGASELGHKLINSAWGVLVVGAGAAMTGGAVAGNAAGKLVGGDTAIIITANFLTPAFYALFLPLLGAGVGLAMIPMIPALMWGTAVVGYVILLVEAVFGSTVWMLAHLHPSGDELGKGSQGYMLLLQLFLRPPLMVLGLISSIALMTPIGWFFSTLFIGASVESGALTGFSGLTMLIAMMFLYGGVQIATIRKLFALIHIIPDQILRWIGHGGGGGGGAMLGDGGGDHASGAGKTLIAAMPTMNGKNMEGAGKAAGEWNKDRRERKLAREREYGSSQLHADNNDTRTANNEAAGEALKNALGRTQAPTDDPGTVSQARAGARRGDGADQAGASTSDSGNGATGGATHAKPEAGGAGGGQVSSGRQASTDRAGDGTDRSTLHKPEAQVEGGQGQGNDAASALRDALAQYTDTGTLKDAKSSSDGNA
ncbi:DotA/TraY family protein [Burkholderia pseudomallei]|uniref:DotA/TraY family protein n=1 Tax=Burkholderia pseudomallei TaxID=28450 RepID=UPI001A005B40|nr:DotA/TraY family protein [Burkholderia pseudomallei]MBF3831159.1 DotA/TraY family protein [Burkholderia pseudomallei]